MFRLTNVSPESRPIAFKVRPLENCSVPHECSRGILFPGDEFLVRFSPTYDEVLRPLISCNDFALLTPCDQVTEVSLQAWILLLPSDIDAEHSDRDFDSLWLEGQRLFPSARKVIRSKRVTLGAASFLTSPQSVFESAVSIGDPMPLEHENLPSSSFGGVATVCQPGSAANEDSNNDLEPDPHNESEAMSNSVRINSARRPYDFESAEESEYLFSDEIPDIDQDLPESTVASTASTEATEDPSEEADIADKSETVPSRGRTELHDAEVAFRRLLSAQDAFKYFSEYEEHRRYEQELRDRDDDAFMHWKRGLASHFAQKEDWSDIASSDVDMLRLTNHSTTMLNFFTSHANNGVLLRLHSAVCTNTSIKETLVLCLVDLELRHKDKELLAIDIDNLPTMTSLEDTLCDALDTFVTCVGAPEDSFSYRAAFPSIRHLVISRTSISAIGSALDRFEALVSLDLSHNKIRSVSDCLSLPNLLRLDISHNFLESLSFVQNLKSLRFLDASYNKLRSLQKSVNILLPLQEGLFSLDLKGNRVCEDMNYAASILEILRSLHFLDGHDLHHLHYLGSHDWELQALRTYPSSQSSGVFKYRKPPVPSRYESDNKKRRNPFLSRLLRALRLFSRRPIHFRQRSNCDSPIMVKNPLLSPEAIDPRKYIPKENVRANQSRNTSFRTGDAFDKVTLPSESA